jgi:hypothetical protein
MVSRATATPSLHLPASGALRGRGLVGSKTYQAFAPLPPELSRTPACV